MTTKLRSLNGRICFDSRGRETIEVEAGVDGASGRASAPAGASVGRLEARAFPSGGPGESMKALDDVRRALIGEDVSDAVAVVQRLRELDGTPDYSRLGGSLVYSLTIAIAEACSRSLAIPLYRYLSPGRGYSLPILLGNAIGGGKHAGPGSPDIQEFLACPLGARNLMEALTANFRVHREVGRALEARNPDFPGGRGDEGAWAERMKDDEALEILSQAVAKVSDELGFEIGIGLDFASSSLWDPEESVYRYRKAGRSRAEKEQASYVNELVERYRLTYVEDPFHEDAFAPFAELTRVARGCLVTGDDLFVTNTKRLEMGAEVGAGNAAILKVNQAGGLGDALLFAEKAREKDYRIVTSHRSGESVDSHISHVAVATGSVMIKCGILGGERVSKLNELIRIAEGYLDETGREMPVAQLNL